MWEKAIHSHMWKRLFILVARDAVKTYIIRESNSGSASLFESWRTYRVERSALFESGNICRRTPFDGAGLPDELIVYSYAIVV